MVPYELTLHNFMCYRADLPPLCLEGLHVACLSGDNGAGKSALLDAITWALWGKARMSDDDLIAQGEAEMQVDLRFTLSQQQYRVIRRRQQGKISKRGKRGASKSSLDFQVYGGQGWRSLSENTQTETQRRIDEVLRMTYETFINASFLLQGRADEFTRKTPAQRKDVLADILNLQEYAMLEERARERRKALEAQLHALDGALELLQKEADKLDLYTQYVADASAKVEHLSAQLARAEEAQQQAEEQVRLLQTKATRRDDVRARLAALRSDQQQQQHEMDTLRQEVAAAEAVLQRKDEIMAGVAELAQAQGDQARLDELRPRYDDLREQRSQHQEAFKDARRALESDLERQQHSVQQVRQQAARQPEVQAALHSLQQQLAELAPLQATLDDLRQQQATLQEHTSSVHGLLLRHSEHSSSIARAREALQSEQKRLQRTLTQRQRQLAERERWQADLQAAQQRQQQASDLAPRLETLRERDRSTSEQMGTLRAQCERFKEQADEIKQRKGMLLDEAATACPLCGSELGQQGIGAVLAHYDEELASLRHSYRTSRDDANTMESSLAALRQEVQSLETELAQAQREASRVAALQQQLAQADAWQQEADEAAAALADIERQLAEDDYAREAREALQTVQAELVALVGETPPTEAAAHLERERKALERQQRSLEKQLAARPQLESQAATRQHDLAQLEQAAAALPAAEAAAAALQQTIEQGDFAHEQRQAIADVEHALAELGYTPDAHTVARERVQALAHWTDEKYRLETASSRLESSQRTLEWYADALQRRAAEIESLQQEEQQLAQELRALPATQQQASECARRASESRNSLRVAQDDLADKQSLQRRARHDAAQLASKQEERNGIAQRKELFQELTEACGKKGVQAMLIETAIPEIEREANRLLSRITDNQMHVSFEMQRSTKSGSTSETLDIKIADALGTRTYDAFSGGEATRINFAIRIALSRLLASRAGASLETLVIDEGMGALDGEGRERFIEAITSIQHDFKRILVVTHLEEMKDRFPARIEITKTPTGSQWALL
jgi:exonuclease SbcC